MHRKWKKRFSSLVVSTFLLSLLPTIGDITAASPPQVSNSTIYHSIASNVPTNFQPTEYSTSPSAALVPSKPSNSKDILAFASGSKQSDSHEPSTVSTATYMRSKNLNVVSRVKELVNKRSRNSKTYLNDDGTTTVQSATYSLNYFDGQAWQDIDTAIQADRSDAQYTHSMLKNNFKVRLNSRGNNQSVTFLIYDESITYKAIGMNNVTGDVYDNLTLYRNAWQSTDLQYQVQNDELKMELHLADEKAPKTFSFEMITTGVQHRMNADGSIDFVDKDGKVNFKIPQMWVQDSSSVDKRYDRLTVDVKQKGNKSLIEIVLNDKDLQYPLIIDPTTSLNTGTDINGSFEQDVNNNNLPDFWEANWRNGSSIGAYAAKAPLSPVDGTYHLRLYNGTGAANSYQYAMSEKIPVIGGATFQAEAFMRYTLGSSSRADLSIIQLDINGTNIWENHKSFNNGGWQWHDNVNTFITKPSTRYVIIRFGVGGEESAYLDVDKVSLQQLDFNWSFEQDVNTNNLPDFWEVNWRNGSSVGANASRMSGSTIDGSYSYRLYSGTGDATSAQYVVSNMIPVLGNSAYSLKAVMRYTLSSGGSAAMSIIELDDYGTNINEIHKVFTNGGGQWHDNSNQFITKPNTSAVVIRFGVGGEQGAYLDVDKVSLKPLDINGSFEQDSNNNNIPDFWEANWRNGTSTGAYAKKAQFSPADGTYHYRLFNGIGDVNSAEFSMSEPIPVISGGSYILRSLMRYTLSSGGSAAMSIIELDANGTNINEIHKVYMNGAWQWNDNAEVYIAKPSTRFIIIRFGVGGEVGAYLDIDTVSLIPINYGNKNGYIYDKNSRLNYIVLPSGQIINLQYDKNGNLQKKVRIN